MPCTCVVTCDICGEAGDEYERGEGLYLCGFHTIILRLTRKKQEYEEKLEWFEQCWGRKFREEIAALEATLEQNTPERAV